LLHLSFETCVVLRQLMAAYHVSTVINIIIVLRLILHYYFWQSSPQSEDLVSEWWHEVSKGSKKDFSV